MKPTLLILIFALFTGCEKDEVPEVKEPEVIKDCHCDRIIHASRSNVSNVSYLYFYTMKNDCTGRIYDATRTTKFELGTCYR